MEYVAVVSLLSVADVAAVVSLTLVVCSGTLSSLVSMELPEKAKTPAVPIVSASTEAKVTSIPVFDFLTEGFVPLSLLFIIYHITFPTAAEMFRLPFLR